MKEKKKIDRLYQEKFKDFTIEPSENVWAGIAAQQNKQKKRIIPLWFQLSGAAAVLILLLLAGTFWFKTENKINTPQLVNQEENITPDSIQKNGSEDYATTNSEPRDTKKDATSTESNSVKANEKYSVENNERINTGNESTSTKSAVVNNNQGFPRNSSVVKTGNLEGSENTPVVNSKTTASDTSTKPNEALTNTNISRKDDAVESAVVQNKSESSKSTKNQALEDIDPDALQKLANKKTNTAVSATEDNTNDARFTRWGITPMVAPVYYDSFSGSGISEQFSDNAKKADVNLSYGVQVSYAVTNRLTVRSGINKVDLGYTTEQIGFTPSISARNPTAMISSIDYNENSQIIQLDNNNIQGLPNLPSNNQTEFATNIVSQKNTSLRQDLGYIEIPIEAEYALINKKVGLQLIGGISSLFLNKNSIFLEEEGNLVSELGKSNSLNNTSFSTNIGLGIDYKFTDKVQFKLEPMFKYQLNAYTKSVSDFKPYYLGLYTGVSFRF